jgi:hypothetical protein
MWYAKVTYGGQLPVNGGTSPNATVVFSPMLEEVIGEINTKEVVGDVK